MNKSIVICIVVCLLFVVAPLPHASAHSAASNNGIKALLHVDPDDAPVAGQSTTFHFEFSDASKLFTVQKCRCTFIVQEQGKQLYRASLLRINNQNTIWSSNASFTFPQKDVYQIEVVGEPLVANTFQPFVLQWDIRVDQIVKNNNTTVEPQVDPFLDYVSHHRLFLIAIVVFIDSLIIFTAGYFIWRDDHKERR